MCRAPRNRFLPTPGGEGPPGSLPGPAARAGSRAASGLPAGGRPAPPDRGRCPDRPTGPEKRRPANPLLASAESASAPDVHAGTAARPKNGWRSSASDFRTWERPTPPGSGLVRFDRVAPWRRHSAGESCVVLPGISPPRRRWLPLVAQS